MDQSRDPFACKKIGVALWKDFAKMQNLDALHQATGGGRVTAGADIAEKLAPRGVRAFEPCLDLDLWGSAARVPTPYLAVHVNRLEANLDRVAAIARSHGVRLRPHVKTHKCIEIARMQLDRGAVGVTASKPQEALVFIGKTA